MDRGSPWYPRKHKKATAGSPWHRNGRSRFLPRKPTPIHLGVVGGAWGEKGRTTRFVKRVCRSSSCGVSAYLNNTHQECIERPAHKAGRETAMIRGKSPVDVLLTAQRKSRGLGSGGEYSPGLSIDETQNAMNTAQEALTFCPPAKNYGEKSKEPLLRTPPSPGPLHHYRGLPLQQNQGGDWGKLSQLSNGLKKKKESVTWGG